MLMNLPVVDQVALTAVKFKSGNLCGKCKFVTIFLGTAINWNCSRCPTDMGLSAEPPLPWRRVIFDILSIALFAGVSLVVYGRLSRAPRLGLSATFGLPSNRRRSSRQCMASGIRKIIRACSYVNLGVSEYAWKTDRENPSLGTNSKLGTPKQLFSLALGPLWRSC